LKNLGLIVSERGGFLYTHAAVLLSTGIGKKTLFPYAKVECARFKGTDTRVFLDQMTCEGPVYTASDLCIDFIKRNISLSSSIGEVYREDRWEYPLNAVREAVNNALIHRDYSILGSDIKIAIYDDMLEITSPGTLPDTISVEQLGSGRSDIRNRILAPLFKDLKLIESWGTGISKMKQDVASRDDIDLILEESGYSFQVRFVKKSYDTKKINDQKQRAGSGQGQGRVGAESENIDARVLKCLKEGPLSKKEIAERLGLETVTGQLNRTVRRLHDVGVIDYTIPEKPNSGLQKYKLI